ncbi:MAG: hypothetical protein Q6364_09440, partial [Candidatus Hermodarchaeota archaeon]|nr:hypothetical protein [Candidatus Hermodarchaeota archaeon]
PGESLVETLTFVGMVDAENINQVAYAPTVAETYAQFFFGYNQTVTGVDFVETSLDPFDINVGETAEISYLVKNGNTTTSDVTIQLASYSSSFDIYYHSSNVTPILDNDIYLYNISQLTMYSQDMTGGTITLYAKSLDSGVLLVTFILELRILVDGIHTQTEYFYLTVRSM